MGAGSGGECGGGFSSCCETVVGVGIRSFLYYWEGKERAGNVTMDTKEWHSNG